MRPGVTVYTRTGCHLCERVEALVEAARAKADFDLSIADVDADPQLRARYGLEVPLVAIDGNVLFNHAMDAAAFLDHIRKSQ
ncbi:MAG: glutaredoxin family protein [Bryobacteraceae bacterium]